MRRSVLCAANGKRGGRTQAVHVRLKIRSAGGGYATQVFHISTGPDRRCDGSTSQERRPRAVFHNGVGCGKRMKRGDRWICGKPAPVRGFGRRRDGAREQGGSRTLWEAERCRGWRPRRWRPPSAISCAARAAHLAGRSARGGGRDGSRAAARAARARENRWRPSGAGDSDGPCGDGGARPAVETVASAPPESCLTLRRRIPLHCAARGRGKME